MKVEFKGGRELQAALMELATTATAKNVVKRALDKAATPIMDEAKRLAPDDPMTGSNNFLRASIKIGERKLEKTNRSFRKNKGVVERYVGIDGSVKPPTISKTRRSKSGRALSSGGSVAAYSIFTEFGKSSMKAQPYMRPAWESQKTVALDRLSDDLKVEIAKAAERAARKALKK